MCGPDLLASGRMRGAILARLVLNLSSVRLAWSCLALPARLGIGLRAWRGASGGIQDFVEIRHRPGMHVRVRVRVLTGIGVLNYAPQPLRFQHPLCPLAFT